MWKSCLQKVIVLLSVVMALVIIVGVSSCSRSQSDMQAQMIAADAFSITAKPFDHWHVLDSQKVEFKVTETASGKGKAGLPVSIQIAMAGSSQVTVRTVEDNGVKDEGNGTYSVNYSILNYVPHAFSLKFIYEGQQFVSQPFVTEVSKHGEEGIKVQAKGTTYLYQIRNFWKPGDIQASDKDMVTLSFELMRSSAEGESINWKEPYNNPTEHITNAVSPQVFVESKDGKVKEKLSPAYKGKGIYEAQRLFTVAEVEKGKDYFIRIVFTDPYNGATLDSEPYPLIAQASN